MIKILREYHMSTGPKTIEIHSGEIDGRSTAWIGGEDRPIEHVISVGKMKISLSPDDVESIADWARTTKKP